MLGLEVFVRCLLFQAEGFTAVGVAELEAALQAGADVNFCDPENGKTALHHSSQKGAGVEVLRLLLEHKADVNAVGCDEEKCV